MGKMMTFRVQGLLRSQDPFTERIDVEVESED